MTSLPSTEREKDSMKHRVNVLKANAFETAVFLTVAAGSLAAGFVVMTIALPFNQVAALALALPTAYWVSVGLFFLTDGATEKVRLRLHRAAHCTDCVPAVPRD